MAKSKYIDIDEAYSWNCYSYGVISVYLAGNQTTKDAIFSKLLKFPTINNTSTLISIAANLTTNFAILIETPETIFAVSDHVRSYPIYYFFDTKRFFSSNSARGARPSCGVQASSRGVGEYLLSGYVHQDRTLYEDLSCLPAGMVLTYDKSAHEVSSEQYFSYLPSRPCTDPVDQLIEEFGLVCDNVFKETAEIIGDRPVFLSLSGGLDSRLVLCKLLEHGCGNVTAFTYGNSNSHEIKKARQIASSLKVKWLPLPARPKLAQALYLGPSRRRYAQYADGLHMTPVYLDFEAIYRLSHQPKSCGDAIIVNGYSGDFLFGGHIPELLMYSPTVENAVNLLIKKNASNLSFPNLATAKGCIRSRLIAQFNQIKGDSDIDIEPAALYEQWDWSERQSKAVVNGQRLYEFFGYDWELPLWNRRLVEFWETIPTHLRLNQSLHIQYLQKYNFRNAFGQLRSTNQIWPTHLKFVTYIGVLLELLRDNQAKNDFYEKYFYKSYFNYQLSLFGRDFYNKHYRFCRRPRVVPLASMLRLRELGIDFKKYVDN